MAKEVFFTQIDNRLSSGHFYLLHHLTTENRLVLVLKFCRVWQDVGKDRWKRYSAWKSFKFSPIL